MPQQALPFGLVWWRGVVGGVGLGEAGWVEGVGLGERGWMRVGGIGMGLVSKT